MASTEDQVSESSSESSLEDLEDVLALDQTSVEDDQNEPHNEPQDSNTTLEELLIRTPPLLTDEASSLRFPTSPIDAVVQSWDIDGIEICATIDDILERIGVCNLIVKATPERYVKVMNRLLSFCFPFLVLSLLAVHPRTFSSKSLLRLVRIHVAIPSFYFVTLKGLRSRDPSSTCLLLGDP